MSLRESATMFTATDTGLLVGVRIIKCTNSLKINLKLRLNDQCSTSCFIYCSTDIFTVRSCTARVFDKSNKSPGEKLYISHSDVKNY